MHFFLASGPSRESVRVPVNDKAQKLEFADLQGRVLEPHFLLPGIEEYQLSVEGQPTGLYLLRLGGENGIATVRLVIE